LSSTSDSKLIDPSGKAAAIASDAAWLMAMRITNGYLLEQFGGATGELTAALQYWVQSFHVENAGIRDMLQDIAIEEF
jgi:Manganese containing catalase